MRTAASRLARFFLVLVSVTAWPAGGADSNTYAFAPPEAKAARTESFRLLPGSAASRLALGEVDSAAIEAVRKANSAAEAKRVQIGIGREVPKALVASSASLSWEAVPGGRAAHWAVSSAGAQALRIELRIARLPADAEIRVAGSGGTGTVYGPFAVADVPAGQGAWWSPVLEDDSAVVELFLPGGRSTADANVALARLSHLFVSPTERNVDSLAKAAGACQVDLVCRSATDEALARAGRAVARMVYSNGGGSFLCTGTLLNPAEGSLTPYFYTAAHCVGTQAEASTLTTHWFYDRTGCGTGGASPSYVQLPGGATLMYANADTDVSLLRLDRSPPSGAVYAGWDAATLNVGIPLTAIHHPDGDLKKVSLGTVGGFLYGIPGGPSGSFVTTLWNSTATGVVEGGSSGSGIFTAVGEPASEYRLRGGLYGGPSSCTATGVNLRDYYSRFDRAFTCLAPYLSPVAGCNYDISPGSKTVGAGASSGSISIATSQGCPWSATSDASWISTGACGSGSGSISFSVAANTGNTARTGTITVGGKSATITQAAGTNLVQNGGFESGPVSWIESATGGAPLIYSGAASAHGGSFYAWLGGYLSGTDSLYQDVPIPAGASSVTLQFWYRITAEGTLPAGSDTLRVLIQNPANGATLATVASYSNADATPAWVQSPAIDITAFAGQTIRLRFTAVNDAADITSFYLDDISIGMAGASATPNYTALWWNPNESGWGINLNHQGDILFGTLFTYDAGGNPLWLVMSSGSLQSGSTYSGTLYRTTGPAFDAVPFTPITFPANFTPVGTMTLLFGGENLATLDYTVNGAPVTRTIQRQVFGSRPATCAPTTANRDSLTNYQDLWWNPNESGWGVNVTHQDNILFATLFTYDATGRDLWLVMSGGLRQSDGSYLGELYRTTGPAFNSNPFTPITFPANFTEVGTMRFRFTDGNNGTLTYTYNGALVTKAITRQVFSSPVPACS